MGMLFYFRNYIALHMWVSLYLQLLEMEVEESWKHNKELAIQYVDKIIAHICGVFACVFVHNDVGRMMEIYFSRYPENLTIYL